MKKLISISFLLVLFAFFSTSGFAVENGGYANPGMLVSTQWLAQHLKDPNVKIIARQGANPTFSDKLYAAPVIPGAIRMATTAVKGTKLGVKEMLIVKNFIEYLEKNGITEKHHVVITGQMAKLPALTRAFWALEYLGHKKVSMLDGGIEKWKKEGRKMVKSSPKTKRVKYHVNLQRMRKVTGEEIYESIGLFDKLNVAVVDSRRPNEANGKAYSRNTKEVMGKVPGATPLMFMALLTKTKPPQFKSGKAITGLFKKFGLTKDKNLYIMCVSGCFGSSVYFGARLVGFEKAALYDGSWIEWVKKGYPIEQADGSIIQPDPEDEMMDDEDEASEGC